MTREERETAIEQLEIAKGLIQQNGKDYLDERDIPILDMAIEALKAEPSEDDMLKIEGMCEDAYEQGYQQARLDYEAEPCADAVSREAVKAAVRSVWKNSNITDFTLEAISKLPSVTPSRKKGMWIFKNDNVAIPTGYYQCSECKDGKLLCKDNFCPNCGAQMEGESE